MTGVWIDSNHEVMYALASKITFICQMDFNAFPVDIQVIIRFSSCLTYYDIILIQFTFMISGLQVQSWKL